MKTLCCAALALSSALALARADEGAYRSLVGMARAARSDRGADVGPAPVDGAKAVPAVSAPAGEAAGDAALKDALRDALADLPAPKRLAALRAASPEPAPAAPAARLWTRLYSTLIPSWRSAPVLRPSFDAPASTAAANALSPLRVRVPPADPKAVESGERRGLAELLSASATPAQPR